MKKIIVFLLLLTTVICYAQTVEYVDDEDCGCSLVFVDGIQTTSEGELFGFRLADGTVIAPNIYKYVDSFHGQYCKVALDDGKWGLIDRTGHNVVPCKYNDVDYPSEGRIKVISGDRYGYCDMNGNMVIAANYPQAGLFSEGVAPVMVVIDSLFTAWTFIDTTGKELLPRVFEQLYPLSEGYAVARRYERWGIIDRDGHEMLPYIYEMITRNGYGIFFAGDEAGMALFDYTFKPLTKFEYFSLGDFSNSRLPVVKADMQGFLDRSGNEVIPCKYDEVSFFRMGRAMVRIDQLYGIIDTNGDIVLPMEYENKVPHGDKYQYHDSLALVEKGGKLGFVDLDGKLVIPMYFEQAYHFSEGLASVRYHGMWGYIDTKGDVYMPFVFDIASPYKWGRAEVIYNGTVSNVDRRGKCVKNCNGVIAWRNWTE